MTCLTLGSRVASAIACGLGLMLLGACSSSVAPSQKLVAAGIWGGDHAVLTVTETGAHLELDCAHGDISQKLMMDANGNVSVDGVFVQEHGGPIIVGEVEVKKPARYAGTVSGDTMTLGVTLTDTQEKIGTFSLTYKSTGHVVKCL
jgi:hypothetical protein